MCIKNGKQRKNSVNTHRKYEICEIYERIRHWFFIIRIRITLRKRIYHLTKARHEKLCKYKTKKKTGESFLSKKTEKLEKNHWIKLFMR